MEPMQLEQKLRTLSDSEHRYQKGYADERAKRYPWVQIGGQPVMKFSYEDISKESNGIPFLVRKHSRFRDYPFHIHDWIEITYMYSGSCTQIIEGKRYEMKTGQLILMAPDTVHTIEKLGEDDILIMISIGQKNLTNNFFNRLSSGSIVTSFFINAFTESHNRDSFFLFHSEKSRRLRLFITEFLCEWYDPSVASDEILNNMFSLIIAELVNCLQAADKSENIYKNDYIVPVLQYIENNYRTCTLSEAADLFSLNPNYLSNVLKNHTGYTFNELVQVERLSAAERLLLNSDRSVTDIASLVGYQNMSFFYRIFKKKNGCLPGDYRVQGKI
ncbi:MAG: AraC family transcriptional regulator [Solobacterium sp.]|nr:AraC family transcriptional regulator [Solobacterium sp.]